MKKELVSGDEEMRLLNFMSTKIEFYLSERTPKSIKLAEETID